MNEQQTTQYYRAHRREVSYDWARLYLRMIAGASIILHNVGKMQNYNEIINSYPSLLGLSGAGWFLFICTIEVCCAAMIIIGLRMRLAATILAASTLALLFFYFKHDSLRDMELEAIYIALYIYLIVVGAGKYALDSLKKN